MPNIWTHLLFGREVLERIGEGEMIGDAGKRRLFQMGCQGPDFLFYHNFLPWKRGDAMNRLGGEMHSRHCGPVLMELLDTVSGLSARRSDPDDAVVYALGFVLHHTLDRNVHPYVFSRSGFRKWDHQRFEVMMDTIVVRRKLARRCGGKSTRDMRFPARSLTRSSGSPRNTTRIWPGRSSAKTGTGPIAT